MNGRRLRLGLVICHGAHMREEQGHADAHNRTLTIPLSAYVEVDSSLFVSERISGVRCRKLRHYYIIPFLLSLSAYSEITEIKMFTGINLAQSLYIYIYIQYIYLQCREKVFAPFLVFFFFAYLSHNIFRSSNKC